MTFYSQFVAATPVTKTFSASQTSWNGPCAPSWPAVTPNGLSLGRVPGSLHSVKNRRAACEAADRTFTICQSSVSETHALAFLIPAGGLSGRKSHDMTTPR